MDGRRNFTHLDWMSIISGSLSALHFWSQLVALVPAGRPTHRNNAARALLRIQDRLNNNPGDTLAPHELHQYSERIRASLGDLTHVAIALNLAAEGYISGEPEPQLPDGVYELAKRDLESRRSADGPRAAP